MMTFAARKTRLSFSLLLAGLAMMTMGAGLLHPVAAQTGPQPTPLPLFALPDPQRSRVATSNTLALARDNRTLVSANMLNNTMSIIRSVQGVPVAQEVPVGNDPRNIALTDDDTRAVVTNRGDGTLSLIDLSTSEVAATIPLDGVWPYGVVMGANSTAYVALQGSNEIVEVNLTAGQVSRRVAVPDAPTGLTLWGDFLYVAHFWSGDVSLVYVPQMRLVSTVSTGVDTGLFQSIEPDVGRGLAYLPQTRSNAQNPNLTYDTTVFPIITVLDFRALTTQRISRINLDTADRPVNMPFAAALDRFQQVLYVANIGTDNISVIDLKTGRARANILVGANPRGLLLNRDNSILYVHNVLESTLSLIETRTLEFAEESVPIASYSGPVETLIAAQLFYSAADEKLSADGWLSCANCHFDGDSDGRVWAGVGDGLRNTPLLYDLFETPPYNWDGSWDELADVELKIRGLQAGQGLISDGAVNPALGDPHAGRSLDLDVLATYLGTLPGPANPHQSDPALIERGAEIFEEQGCAECHAGTAGTNTLSHDVGTGGTFDTPSLRWLWTSAPYFHDGAAASLRDVFMLPGAHYLAQTMPMEDIDALTAYLLTLPA